MVHRFAWVLLLLVGCGGSQPSAASPTTDANGLATVTSSEGDRLPAGWVASEMLPSELGAHDLPVDREVTARVLTWRVKEDERPLYVESAIVWATVRAHGNTHWLLLHVYRHPREQGVANVWRLSMVADSDVSPAGHYEHAPTNADVSVFMGASGWRDGNTGFRVLGEGVCEHAWTLSTGTPPPLGK